MLGQARDHGLPETQLIDVEDVTVHPDYNTRYPLRGNDIALVRLAKSVLLSYVSNTKLIHLFVDLKSYFSLLSR